MNPFSVHGAVGCAFYILDAANTIFFILSALEIRFVTTWLPLGLVISSMVFLLNMVYAVYLFVSNRTESMNEIIKTPFRRYHHGVSTVLHGFSCLIQLIFVSMAAKTSFIDPEIILQDVSTFQTFVFQKMSASISALLGIMSITTFFQYVFFYGWREIVEDAQERGSEISLRQPDVQLYASRVEENDEDEEYSYNNKDLGNKQKDLESELSLLVKTSRKGRKG